MTEETVFPSADAWKRVAHAVRKVESGGTGFHQSPRDAYYSYPAVVVKVTGTPSGGYYPGVILAWNSETGAWVETEACVIRQEGA